ncbi:MAG: acyl-CoA dehydratase activase [Thermodesulfobacteriota bacterium]
MAKYFGGCDLGSTTGKAVILKDGKVVSSATIRSRIDPVETGKEVLELAIRQVEGISSVRDLAYLVGTGYGRNEVPFANENVSEISCHALGANFLDSKVRTIIDVGGQDVKAISLDEKGAVLEFAMNDKCAAGTGRFYEAVVRTFDVTLDQFSALSLKAKKVVPVTSQCTVFAESELVSLLYKRHSPADIAAGVQLSVAKRVFTLVRRVGVKEKVVVTGGCAKNLGLIKALEKVLRVPISDLPLDPQLMGALGAAVVGWRKG